MSTLSILDDPLLQVSMLRNAASQGDLKMLKYLLVDVGVNVNIERSTGLLYACLAGKEDVALYLLKKGADVSLLKDPLGNVCNKPMHKLIHIILRSGVSTPTAEHVMMAQKHSCMEVVLMLTKPGHLLEIEESMVRVLKIKLAHSNGLDSKLISEVLTFPCAAVSVDDNALLKTCTKRGWLKLAERVRKHPRFTVVAPVVAPAVAVAVALVAALAAASPAAVAAAAVVAPLVVGGIDLERRYIAQMEKLHNKYLKQYALVFTPSAISISRNSTEITFSYIQNFSYIHITIQSHKNMETVRTTVSYAKKCAALLDKKVNQPCYVHP